MKARKIGRLLSALLALAMLLTLMPMSAFAAAEATIDVIKVDDKGKNLDGATFGLYEIDAAGTPEEVPSLTAVSGERETGKASFHVTSAGHYLLKEISAPNGYLKSNETYVLYVDGNYEAYICQESADGHSTHDVPYQNNQPLTFYNDPVTFTVNKVDDRGAPVAGAAFALYVRDRDGAGWMPEPSYEAKSNASGAAVFSAVANGYYLLKETSAPNGYVKSDDSYEIYVNNDRPDPVWLYKEVGSNGEPYAPVTFVNQRVFGVEDIPDPIRITVNKVDEKGDPLQGATFALYEKTYTSEGEEIVAPEPAYEAVSSKRGTAVFRNVKDGYYVLKEVSAPDGYAKSDDSYEVYVDESRKDSVWIFKEPESNGEPYSPVTFINKSKMISVNKVDENGKPLAGASFGLYEKTYTPSGEEIAPEPAYEAISNSDGVAAFGTVKDGFYILKEIYAPDGYTKSDVTYEVYVDETRPDPVWLYKEPGSNGEPYAPVTFVNTSEAAAPGSRPAEPSAPGSEPAGPTEPTVPAEPGPDDTDVPIANPPKTGNGVLASGAALTGLLCCAAAVVLYGKKKK